MTLRRALCAILALAATGAGLACGPSFQAIYEGNARFEHCYALEERPQIALNEKADCWHDWSERYTYGQTRDRIHYATARYVALSQSLPTDEAMMMAAPGMTPRTSSITAPIPTNAFAPPPKVLDGADAAPSMPPRPNELPYIVSSQPPGGTAADARATPLVAGRPDAGAESSHPGAPSASPAPPSVVADCVAACNVALSACKTASCEKTYRACVRVCIK